MKQNTEDFFEQMKNFKTNTKYVEYIFSIIILICILVSYIILLLVSYNLIPLSEIVLTTLIICAVIAFIMFVLILTLLFAKNGIRFLAGNFSAGLKSFTIVMFPIYGVLIILFIVLPAWRDFLRSAFTIITTIGVGFLTIMGVHYSITKQQQSKNEEKNLIFTICDDNAELINYSLSNSTGNQILNLNLKNISNNFGFLIGLYRICGCDAHQIGDDLPYLPIEPNSGYSLTDIKTNLGDDQLLIVYKDIGENYYYLLISSNYQFIESSDKCNMDFLRWRLYMTTKSEQKFKKKIHQSDDISTHDGTYTVDDKSKKKELSIDERKAQTKPIHTKRENGFDLIVSLEGEVLTDMVLLSALRKERSKLSKEKQVKAYMIFNNQQLVAMATYKPKDELSFISIYGLGKKKYELYGNVFQPIILEHID